MPEVIEAEDLVLTRWSPELVSGLRARSFEKRGIDTRWLPSAASEQQDAEQFVPPASKRFDSGSRSPTPSRGRECRVANVRIDGGCAVPRILGEGRPARPRDCTARPAQALERTSWHRAPPA